MKNPSIARAAEPKSGKAEGVMRDNRTRIRTVSDLGMQ